MVWPKERGRLARFLHLAGQEQCTTGETPALLGAEIPVTSEALVENGYQPHREAKTHDIPGLVAAVLALAKD